MRVALLLVAVGLLGCRGDDATPGGVLTLNFESPSTNDGAVVLLIAGGAVSSVHPTAGYQVSSSVDSNGTHLIFLGDLVSGPLATVEVPDVGLVSRYLAVVEQVADRSAFTLLDPSGYHVTLQTAAGAALRSDRAP